jgi:hypothetical protein
MARDAQRVAAGEPAGREPAPANGPVPFDGLSRIVRTRRQKAA